MKENMKMLIIPLTLVQLLVRLLAPLHVSLLTLTCKTMSENTQ